MESKRLINATCPDCRGPLTETQEDGHREFQCLVGHVYSPQGLLRAHAETQECTLWSAVVVLEEAANLVEAAAPDLPAAAVDRLRHQVKIKHTQAAAIRRILEELEPFQIY